MLRGFRVETAKQDALVIVVMFTRVPESKRDRGPVIVDQSSMQTF